MIDEMVTWLRSQVDDDERVARNAAGPPARVWRVTPAGGLAQGAYMLLQSHQVSTSLGSLALEHIARHDPAWALSDAEAKRKILDRYEDCRARRDDPDYPSIVAIEQMREYEDFILPALALSYAGRPGFEEVWAL